MQRSVLATWSLIPCMFFGVHASAQAPSYTSFGSGCPGRVGVPLLEAEANSLPVLGGTFRAELSNVPDGSAIAITGLSTTHWLGFPLPLDLGLVYMPGCTLFTDHRRFVALSSVGRRATWAMVMPTTPEWIGRSFFQQVFVLDSSVPGLGAIMSNAAIGVIGVASPAPRAEISFPPPTSLTDEGTILVRGHATDPDGVAEVRVNGLLATTSDGFFNWQVRVPLARGSNTITVATRDVTGVSDPQAAEAHIGSEFMLRSLGSIALDVAHNRFLVTNSSAQGGAAIVALDITTGKGFVLSDETTGLGPAFASPQGIVLDGSRALVTDKGLQTLFAVDLATGDRSIISDGNTGTGPGFDDKIGAIALDGTRALVVNPVIPNGAFLSSIIAVDLLTGNRSILSGPSTPGSGGFFLPDSIAVDGTRALVTDVNKIFSVDLATGAKTAISTSFSIPNIGTGPPLQTSGIVLDGNRALVGNFSPATSSGEILAVDLTTGDRTLLSGFGMGTGSTLILALGITLDANRLLVLDQIPPFAANRTRVVAVDLATGDRTSFSDFKVGTGPELAEPEGIALDGDRALVTDPALRAVYEVDLTTGNRRVISDSVTGAGPEPDTFRGIAVDGSRALVTGPLQVVAVDLATGDRSVLSSNFGVGLGPEFRDLADITLDGNRALVTNRASRGVHAVDLVSGNRTSITGVSIGTGTLLSRVSHIILDGSRALVTDAGLRAVLAIELATGDRTLLSDASTGAGQSFTTPLGLALYKNRVLVTDEGIDNPIQVHVVDLATGNRTILADAQTGTGPRILDPRAIVIDRSISLVADSLLGTLFAIDVETGERVILSR